MKETKALLLPTASIPSWSEYLRSQINFSTWRPTEFDPTTLVYAPDPENPNTMVTICSRQGCSVVLNAGTLCPGCKNHFRKQQKTSGISRDAFLLTVRATKTTPVPATCQVENCERIQHRDLFCTSHGAAFRGYRTRVDRSCSPEQWLANRTPTPAFARLDACAVATCPYNSLQSGTLCLRHNGRFELVCRKGLVGSVNEWLDRYAEPFVDSALGTSYASSGATPLALLPEPLRWELLYAVQQRDAEGLSKLPGISFRSLYRHLRATGISSIVGLDQCAWDRTVNSNMIGFLRGLQWHVDEAQRKWAPPSPNDPLIIPFRDLELKTRKLRTPRHTNLDLSSVSHVWISDAVVAWARAKPRTPESLRIVQRAWLAVDSAIPPSVVDHRALTPAHMDLAVKILRTRTKSVAIMTSLLRSIRNVIDHARADHELRSIWDEIHPGFSINQLLHFPPRQRDKRVHTDEPFRFVPQPIIDWVMDHLNLLEYSTPYKTAEARTMVYLQERCGRRTSETASLKSECISYDSEGAPYLEWTQGKPPYARGARLPIHQETHDAILQWKELQRTKGIVSEWLFPSDVWMEKDLPYEGSSLQRHVKRLVKRVAQDAPFDSLVAGPEGNLVHFDLLSIDAYSLRHAFAQRLADAVDENGRSTTPPDVLQSFMGHKSFRTTQGYYAVTAKRRKFALDSLPPRKLDINGAPHVVSDERDGYLRLGLSVGACSEPQNVASAGRSCAINYACESCPFFLVDPLDREGILARLTNLEVQRERALAIDAPDYHLQYLSARIRDCESVIAGIDRHVQSLPLDQRGDLERALAELAVIRKRAVAPRLLNLQDLLGIA